MSETSLVAARRSASRNGPWMAFLAIAIGVVGLTGLLATYAMQIPYERAMAREAAIADVVAALTGPRPVQTIQRIRADVTAEIGDAAAPLIDGPGDIGERAAALRAEMQTRLRGEAGEITARLRVLICIVTVMCGVFGVVVLGAAGPRSRD